MIVSRLQRLRARLREKLVRSPAAANVLRMLAGNASAQLLTLAAYPLLTRLYTPAEIGVLSVLSAAITILAPAASLRLEMALPLSRTDREAGSMLVACGLALLLTTLAAFGVMALLPPAWPGDMSAAAPYRWFLPLALFAFGGYVILVNEATRRNRFSDIARTRVLQAFNGPAIQIGAGWWGLGSLGLLVGLVVGQCSGSIGLALKLLRGPASPLRRWSFASVRAAVMRHHQFALFSSWTGVVSAASTYLMTLAFAFIYGPAVSGFMFLGERVLMRPLFLITSAILPVYTREVARIWSDEPARLPTLFQSVVKKQLLVSLAWLVPIVLVAPYIVPRLFGPTWAEAALYVQVLAIGYLPTSVLHPVLHTLQLLKRQKLAALLDVLRSLAVFGAIGAVAAVGVPPLTAALLCSLVQACTQVAVLVVTWRTVGSMAAARSQRG